MRTVAGVMRSEMEVSSALQQLHTAGFADKAVNVLAPGRARTVAVPTDGGEQPGVGRAIGGVVSGAAGAAWGMQMVAAGVAGFIPGAGPVIAVGLLAGLIAGVGGAAAGHALEQTLTRGLPKDELYVYEAALRQGRSVVIVMADDEAEAEHARAILHDAGAESVDAARESWWVGLRDAEAIAYPGGEQSLFARDETTFRRGFEMAMALRGKTFVEAEDACRERDPDLYQLGAYRRGFERGLSYVERQLVSTIG